MDQEARLFANYLIRTEPSPANVQLYTDAVGKNIPTAQDRLLLDYIRRHPGGLRFIDAALPFRRPQSEVRRRLYLMLAILEASPEHADQFLSQKQHPFYFVRLSLAMVSAVCKTAIGLVLMRVIEYVGA